MGRNFIPVMANSNKKLLILTGVIKKPNTGEALVSQVT